MKLPERKSIANPAPNSQSVGSDFKTSPTNERKYVTNYPVLKLQLPARFAI